MIFQGSTYKVKIKKVYWWDRFIPFRKKYNENDIL
jgi:hypothetical protein